MAGSILFPETGKDTRRYASMRDTRQVEFIVPSLSNFMTYVPVLRKKSCRWDIERLENCVSVAASFEKKSWYDWLKRYTCSYLFINQRHIIVFAVVIHKANTRPNDVYFFLFTWSFSAFFHVFFTGMKNTFYSFFSALIIAEIERNVRN